MTNLILNFATNAIIDSVSNHLTIKDDEKKFNYFNEKNKPNNFFNFYDDLLLNSDIKKTFLFEDDKESILSNFKKEFKLLASNEELEFGIKAKTTEFVENFAKKDKDLVFGELQKMALEDFSNKNLIYPIVHTFAHLDYDLVYPTGPIFALAVSRHKDIEIQDYAIQCFEIWGEKSSLGYLKEIHIDTPWLSEYLTEVITEIEDS